MNRSRTRAGQRLITDTDSRIIDSHHVTITHPTVLLFPESGFTKLDLVNYYQRIVPYMIPHIAHYPVSMKRFPDGIAHEGFFQKDTPDYFPSWIDRVAMKKKEGVTHHVVCNNAATLVYLANQASIELHLALSQEKRVTIPTKMIFDLDPSSGNMRNMRFLAQSLKQLLEDVGLQSFLMNTGSRGVHIIVLLKPKHTFDEVYTFAYDIARIVVARHPQIATLQLRKNKRGSNIFIDVLRNGYGATAIAPFSVRAKPGAPVATPLSWTEFFRGTFDPQRYTIANIFRRLSTIRDPWIDMNNHIYILKKARRLVDNILKGLS